jgi:hypothetical protein
MDIQELLKKRVIVENLWPDCLFKAGEILTINEYNHYVGNDKNFWFHKSDIEPFPYLMRPLAWWEERDEKDMPEYLKFDNGMVVKVDSYLMDVGFNYL